MLKEEHGVPRCKKAIAPICIGGCRSGWLLIWFGASGFMLWWRVVAARGFVGWMWDLSRPAAVAWLQWEWHWLLFWCLLVVAVVVVVGLLGRRCVLVSPDHGHAGGVYFLSVPLRAGC